MLMDVVSVLVLGAVVTIVVAVAVGFTCLVVTLIRDIRAGWREELAYLKAKNDERLRRLGIGR